VEKRFPVRPTAVMAATVAMKTATPRIQKGLFSAKTQSNKKPTSSSCPTILKEAILHCLTSPSFKTSDKPILTAIRSDAKSSCPPLRKI